MTDRNAHIAEPIRSIINAASPLVRPMPTWRGVKINASFIYPPIPWRSHDWCATTDNYDGTDGGNEPIGYGSTEAAAIADLIEQLEDADEPISPDNSEHRSK